METKICKSCLQEKSVSSFGTDNISKDGLRYRCKECDKERKPSVGHILVLEGIEKKCGVCLETKDLAYFKRRQGRNYTHEPRCKKCEKEKKFIDLGTFKDDQRKCATCKKYKNFNQFYKLKSSGKLVSDCVECSKNKSKIYRESLSEEERRAKKKEEYKKNKESYLRRSKEYVENNREIVKNKKREYYRNLKDGNFLLYLKRNVSSLVRRSFIKRSEDKGGKKTVEILGCTIEEFKKHIESQFLSWMSWDNYGNCENYSENCSWNLDHIVPLSQAKTEEEVTLLNHWSNFQPLCSLVNKNIKRNILYPCTNIKLNKTFY